MRGEEDVFWFSVETSNMSPFSSVMPSRPDPRQPRPAIGAGAVSEGVAQHLEPQPLDDRLAALVQQAYKPPRNSWYVPFRTSHLQALLLLLAVA